MLWSSGLYLKQPLVRFSWQGPWATLALVLALSRGGTADGCPALEKTPFFLQLELLPAGQSHKLPSCDAKNRHKVMFREVILKENRTCSEQEGRAFPKCQQVR